MIKFKQYQEVYEEISEISEKALLITDFNDAIEFVLKDLRTRLQNDIRHNKMKFVNQIAGHVKKRLNKKMQGKGRVAVETI